MLAMEEVPCDCEDGPCGWLHVRTVDMPDEGED